MPAATTQSDLLARTECDYEKLCRVLDQIPRGQATQVGEDGLCPRDIVGHRAHWIDLFLGWQADAAAGRKAHIPAKGYKWSELAAYNAKLRDAQSTLSWEDVRAALKAAHGRLVAFISAQDDAALYGGPMTGQSKWTTGRYAEAAGPSHYRSAAKVLRAQIRAMADVQTA